MQSTVDWMNEMSTKFQTESNSTEDVVTPAMQRGPGITKMPFQVAVLAVGVLGILANLLVLFGFWLAGRSKMNVSSAYIANHTILELFAVANVVTNFSLMLSGKHFGPTVMMNCFLIRTGALIGVGNYGGRACILIHTLDRYWKIVHPIHHRKYYRRWMSYFGMILPWLLGIVVELPPAVATTRIFPNGMCRERAFWASETAHRVCCYCLKPINILLILNCPFPH